jgi:hypothetical protein
MTRLQKKHVRMRPGHLLDRLAHVVRVLPVRVRLFALRICKQKGVVVLHFAQQLQGRLVVGLRLAAKARDEIRAGDEATRPMKQKELHE